MYNTKILNLTEKNQCELLIA